MALGPGSMPQETLAVLSSMATRGLLATLSEAFSAETGQEVAVRSIGGVEAARRVRAGEPVDAIVLAADVLAALEREGHVRAGSRAPLVRSDMALAVPDGAPSPDITDTRSLRDALLAAPAIYYSTGASGDHLKRILALWSIADTVADRLVQAPVGVPVGTLLVANGAGVALQQRSELSGIAGLTIAGAVPPELGASTVFEIGMGSRSTMADAVRSFTAFATADGRMNAKRSAGFDAV